MLILATPHLSSSLMCAGTFSVWNCSGNQTCRFLTEPTQLCLCIYKKINIIHYFYTSVGLALACLVQFQVYAFELSRSFHGRFWPGWIACWPWTFLTCQMSVYHLLPLKKNNIFQWPTLPTNEWFNILVVSTVFAWFAINRIILKIGMLSVRWSPCTFLP